MNKKRGEDKITVFLVKRKGETEKGIIRAINQDVGGIPTVVFVHSHRLFTSIRGLATLLEQNKNLGKVYVMMGDVLPEAIMMADKTEVPYGVLFKSNGKWTISLTAQDVIKGRKLDNIETVA